MAAATVSTPATVRGATFDVVTEVYVSAMTDGQQENIAHGGPDGVPVDKVEVTTTTETVSASPIEWSWIKASDSTANNTACLRFFVPAGGDITSGIVRVRFYFASAKSGGLITA